MIRRFASDLASFKTLTFEPGLNILLADKSAGANDRQSRNGAGKTSFIELVHFLFGSEVRKENIFRSDALSPWTFDVTVDIGGETVSAARSGSKPSRIFVNGALESWHVPTKFDERAGLYELSNENWKAVLGHLWFGLPYPAGDNTERFQPSFRALFSYFARRQLSGGFQQPMQNSTMQQPWDQQVSICYLLGLDWTIPGRFQELRSQEKVAQELRRAARSGDLGRFFGKAADLRTRLTVAEARAARLRSQLEKFEVVPEYKALEREATDITREIDALNVENVVDADLLQQLRASLADEDAPDLGDVTKLYAEAGVVLPEMVRRRFDEVEKFHRTIIENRRAHLHAEIASGETRITERDQRVAERDRRRRQIMEILRSGGALEHYTSLREEAGRAEAEVEGLRQRLETAERIESTKAELDIERANLTKALRDDIHERSEVIREAILAFEALSESLYEKAGSLTISETGSGPQFEVHIDGQRSKGITNMQIFCFDLMLTEISLKHGRGPGFLIHDSHLFDGVDERQVAKALQLGAERAEAAGFQYIVTMNSDALPREGFRSGFDIGSYVMDTKLTDATDTGGLFGLRFE
ncbi:ABC-three component system protein [Burkholderia cepacia]|uniref:ABC-three component system protein n=1 Tax=Burkholderia cepacia TaxID=292 RepID=UPI002AB7E675|nr:ABC-three component system protein [Burkholderia cepacia]